MLAVGFVVAVGIAFGVKLGMGDRSQGTMLASCFVLVLMAAAGASLVPREFSRSLRGRSTSTKRAVMAVRLFVFGNALFNAAVACRSWWRHEPLVGIMIPTSFALCFVLLEPVVEVIVTAAVERDRT
jgi:hypothetical protein